MLSLSISGGLDRPEVTFDEGRRACVSDLSVYEKTGNTYSPLWSIEATGRNCVMLRRVVYGETPTGFKVSRPAAPLRADGVYQAVGKGMTTDPLTKVPWLGSMLFHFHDDQWRIVPQGAEPS